MFKVLFCVLVILMSTLEAGLKLQTLLFQGASLKNLFLVIMIFISLAMIGKKKQPGHTKTLRVFFVFLIYALGLTVVNHWLGSKLILTEAIIGWKGIVLNGFIAFVSFSLILTDEKKLLSVLQYVILLFSIFGLMTIVEANMSIEFFGRDDNSIRPNGPFGEPNQSGCAYTLLFPFILAQYLAVKNNKIITIFNIVVFCITLIVLGSRGALVSTLMASLFFLYRVREYINLANRLKIAILAMLSFLMVILVLPDTIIDPLMDRIGFMTEKKMDFRNASAGRTLLWELALDLWFKSPIFGYGWGGYQFVYKMATHNTFIQVMVDLGLIGLALYLNLYLKILKQISKAYKQVIERKDKILLTGMTSSILGLLMSVFFVNIYNGWIIIWAILGLYISLARTYYFKNIA